MLLCSHLILQERPGGSYVLPRSDGLPGLRYSCEYRRGAPWRESRTVSSSQVRNVDSLLQHPQLP